MTTTLYRFFDADNRLLYVGVAADPLIRLKQHHDSRWWELADHATFVHLGSREEALSAELAAIETERPLYNGTHRPSDVVIVPVEGTRYGTQSIAEAIGTPISAGEVPGGAKLPTIPEIAKLFRVSRATADRAIAALRKQGLVEGAPGRGVFVTDRS